MAANTHTGRVALDEHAFYELVLNVARRLATTSDLLEVLALVIDTLRDSFHAERASVFQYDPLTHELFATQAHGLSRSLRLPADKGIIGEAARTRLIINIPDAYADPRFNPQVDVATGFKTRCLLTIPLLDDRGSLVGVAQLLNKSASEGGVFTAQDEKLAGYLADQAALALKRAVLVEAHRIKEKLEADIDVARRIQTAALPQSLPAFPGYDLAAHFEPADETAGDAYDVIDLRPLRHASAPDTGPHAMLFIADATGHGIGPALSAAQALAMLRMGSRLGAPAEQLAENMNAQLCADLPAGRFVTAFLGSLDIAAHRLAYVSAGQAPIVFVRAGHHGDFEERPANSLPFGIDAQLAPEHAEPFAFAPGDTFVMLSDGYYESCDPSGEYFGTQRVVDAVRRLPPNATAIDVINEIRAALATFTTGAPPQDDRTALIVRRMM